MRLVAALALAVIAWPAAAATAWRMDPTQSLLEFTVTQAGARVTGRFTRFSAAIRFDGADLPDSRFDVRIDVASADTRDAERDEVLHGPDFFFASAYPEARFVAERFAAQDGGWTADGTLTLRGLSRPVPALFKFERAASGAARLTGSAAVNRLGFAIGLGEWADTRWIGDTVEVAFSLRLVPVAEETP